MVLIYFKCIVLMWGGYFYKLSTERYFILLSVLSMRIEVFVLYLYENDSHEQVLANSINKPAALDP